MILCVLLLKKTHKRHMRIVLALNMSELVGINLSSFLSSVSATLISVIEIMVWQI